MKEYAYFNFNKLPEIAMRLTGSEIKMLFAILYYLSSNNKDYYPNSPETREYLASLDRKLTKERVCVILSSLVKKGVIKREAQAVYSVDKSLYLPVDIENTVKFP